MCILDKKKKGRGTIYTESFRFGTRHIFSQETAILTAYK